MPTKNKRLTANQIKSYRTQQLIKQQYKCALCNEIIEPGQEVLDHDHTTGLIRKVLHRGCNALEGIITNNLKRNLISKTRYENILKNLIEYQTTTHTDVLHSTYRTPEEKQQRAKDRAKKRRILKKKEIKK